MTGTYTQSQTNTFTKSHAEYLASKVKTDLMRLHYYYYETHGSPSENEVNQYHEELVLLQTFDLLGRVQYGFVLGDTWVKALRYKAGQGGVLTADDDDPGGVRYTLIPKNARFSSFLTYNNRWDRNSADTQNFLQQRPFDRTPGQDHAGNWTQQRVYSAAGRELFRSDI